MKALSSVGIGKALRYLWYGFYAGLIHWVHVPPLRTFLLRLAGATVGRDTVFFDAIFINLYHYGFRTLAVGDRCFIGDGVMLDTRGKIILEDDVTLSGRTNIVTHINVGYDDHPLQRFYPTKESIVRLKKGVYVGTAATILPGVTVGKGSIVAAGAVVTKDVSPGVVVAGVPARVIKQIRQMINTTNVPNKK